ncbi:hypothetical protein [Clostridium felsineum]|uniref:Uncharacterized protein n=1 Tax=Clostridium felsineum TaxID=36839 RepID=A0A1S8M7Y2_9CLOT|nr:hypothetical protein [Clostridium felsineum]URZ07739.1 hypothetical protein CLROS_031000 [Clostridium felsineum]URZ12770.1 hypothetical protein CROST_035150 [Clostridium felsineum]
MYYNYNDFDNYRYDYGYDDLDYDYNDENDVDFDPMRFENDDLNSETECPFFPDCQNTRDPMPPHGHSNPPMPPHGHMPPGHNPPGQYGQPGYDQMMPPGPPPTYVPQFQSGFGGSSIKAVDSGAIRICRYKYTYIWLNNGREFWAYITFVGPRSISGYRWMGRRWVYFGLDLRQIRYFVCR